MTDEITKPNVVSINKRRNYKISWIPVTDELPPADDPVLIYYIDREDPEEPVAEYGLAYYLPKEARWMDLNWTLTMDWEEVTHWAKLTPPGGK